MKSRIQINQLTKARIARTGHASVFGARGDRKQLSYAELVKLFDEIWDKGLREAVENSRPCEFDAAKFSVLDKYKKHIDPAQEQRRLIYNDTDFIVQFDSKSGNAKVLTQLWKIHTATIVARTISVKFDSAAELQRFRAIAEHLQRFDDDLALEIIREYMAKFDDVVPKGDVEE